MAGRKREYETIYILRPDTTNDGISPGEPRRSAASSRRAAATLLKVDNWGKRKLAYEVKKQLKGIYLFFYVPGHRRPGRGDRAQPAHAPTRSSATTRSRSPRTSTRPPRTVDGHRRDLHQGRDARPRRGGDRDRSGRVRARRSTRKRARFDFEEAVFGSADEPAPAGEEGHSHRSRPKQQASDKGDRGDARQDAAGGPPQAAASSARTRRSRSTTRTPACSSTSSPIAASWSRGGCRATAPSTSARSPSRSTGRA